MTRVLLSSAFKPFGVDNVYSRRDSKIELYHNQLTKYQGVYSMREFMNSYGLHAIANNIETPATVLEFPTLERFRKEAAKGYDIVGIGAIVPNFLKVKKMVEETREVAPRTKIVIGGFCATLPNLEKMMDVDHVCVGDGISFMRDLLGRPAEFTFKNPDVFAESREVLGVPIFGIKNPHIVVGLGCSYGCDFCSPSHFFGRRHLKFYTRGQALFEEMRRVEKRFRSNMICFIGDDNFLLDRERAEELRECVAASGRAYNVMIFGSADKAAEFTPRKLAEMGVGVIWIGREGKFASYRKNRGVDLKGLIAELRSFGIKTILSSILLLDSHTQDNIREDIEDHLDCRPVFSQFSHFSPAPGTPFWDRMKEEGRLLEAIPYEDCHAFKQPWFIHPEFSLVEAEKAQDESYLRDFHLLGPSLVRYIDVEYEGWRNLKDSAERGLKARADRTARKIWMFKILLRACESLAPTPEMGDLIGEVRGRVEGSFGKADPLSRAAALGIMGAGRLRELRTRLFGDALQPWTRAVKYNY